jgi:hypothetical protein
MIAMGASRVGVNLSSSPFDFWEKIMIEKRLKYTNN